MSKEVTIKVRNRSGKSSKAVRIRLDLAAINLKDGKLYFIEVKNNTGRLTKGQKRSGLFNLKKAHNNGGKCQKAAYKISTKNQDKRDEIGEKGIANFMTLVFKD